MIRAPMDGKIIRRYANPGSGASTLNVSTMFDLEPDIAHIIRSEIVESSIPAVFIGQQAEIVPEADPSTKAMGRVIRIAATFGARKLKSDTANEASDDGLWRSWFLWTTLVPDRAASAREVFQAVMKQDFRLKGTRSRANDDQFNPKSWMLAMLFGLAAEWRASEVDRGQRSGAWVG